MKKIHIVGCSSRSGTTLMMELMSNGFDIDVVTTKEIRISKSPPQYGETLLTKTPKDIIVAKDMLSFIKDLYIIYMLRDPRDVISSKHPWDKDRYWNDLNIWKMWTKMGDKLKDHPRFITVRYEDLVTQPNEIQELISQKLPFLDQTTLFSNFHQKATPSDFNQAALKGLRPVSTKSIGNWRKHKARLAGQIVKHGSINKELIAYGYEKDDSWEKELEGIVPDMRDGHPAFFSTERYVRKRLRWNKLRAIRVLINHSRWFLFLKNKLR